MDLPAGLRDNPFFRDLSDNQVTQLTNLAVEKQFQGGDTVVRQFDKQSDMMIVTRGKVLIKTFSGETIAELAPGAVIGEVSLVDDAPRSATVVAMGPATMAVLPSTDLKNLLASDPFLKSAVMENVARILCARLRAANVHLDAAGVRG